MRENFTFSSLSRASWPFAAVSTRNPSSERVSENASLMLLIIDDERSIREAFSETLSEEGFLVETAANGQEALDKLEKVKFSLIITDMKMPGISGIELYETILKRHPRLKGRVIIMTGDVISADTKDFFRNADCHYMLKPFNVKELIKLARKLLSSTAAQG